MVFRDTPLGGMLGQQTDASVAAPLPQATEIPPPTTERLVTLDDLGLKGNAPDIAAVAPVPRPTVAVPEGTPRLSEILNEDEDEEGAATARGVGPRLVILHDFVKGHPRGKVVWASDVLNNGVRVFVNADSDDPKLARPAQLYIRKELKRLIALKAVREATRAEAGYEAVKFVETQEQAESELVRTQARASELEGEVERLRRLLAQQQGNLQDTGPEGVITTAPVSPNTAAVPPPVVPPADSL